MVVLEGVLVLMAAAKQAAADLIRTKPSPKGHRHLVHEIHPPPLHPLVLDAPGPVLRSYDQCGITTFPVGFA